MRRNSLLPCIIILAGVLCPIPLFGQTTETDPPSLSQEARLQQMEREIAALRAELRATRQQMSGQPARFSSEVTPPAAGPQHEGKESKVVLPTAPEPERWHFFLGADLLVVQPRWSINPALNRREFSTSDGFDVTERRQVNFEHDFNATPVITAGVVSPSGLGLRARYWFLDSDADEETSRPTNGDISPANPLDVGFGSGADHINTDSNLRMHVGDLEATYQTNIGRLNALFSGGARIASIKQSYDAFGRASGETFQFHESTRFSHDVIAAGPTVAADLSYPFGNSGFSVYGNARGAVLFGDRDESGTERFSGTFDNGNVTERFINHSSLSQEAVVSVLETEVGFGWAHGFGRFQLELRAGVVGQMWFDAGNASQSEEIIGETRADESLDPGIDLGLVGFRAGAKITF